MGGLFLLPVPLPMGEKSRGQLNGKRSHCGLHSSMVYRTAEDE